MRWGKIVLIFQAVVTLIIGVVFFLQFTAIDKAEITTITAEITSGNSFTNDIPPALAEIKQRYTMAAYTLLIVSIIELVIISRLIE